MIKNVLNKIEKNVWATISLGIILYNFIIILRYYLTGFWLNDFHLYQFAFTYQDCGFITRGLVSSLVAYFNLRPIVFLYILCNISLIIYIYLIYYIINMHNIENKYLFLIGFLFLFFGIPHFALDALRLDIILQALVLLVFVLLHNKKILSVMFICILGMLIHEGIYFLLVPIFFLKIEGNKRWYLSILISIIFLAVVLSANKITKEQAIELAATKIGMFHVPETYYIPQVSSATDNALHVFKTYKMQYAFIFLIIYLTVLFVSFKNIFRISIKEMRWLCLFPILICLVAADWFRWICFVYFITMLYVLVYDKFTIKTFKNFAFLTIILGIPIGINIKYGILPTFIQFLSKLF